MYSLSIANLIAVLQLNCREKPRGADLELLFFPLQHDGGFAGSEGGSTLDCIGLPPEGNRRAGLKVSQSFVIPLRIDLFHDLISYHNNRQSLSRLGYLPLPPRN